MSIITGTISSLKTAGDIAKSIVNLKSVTDVRAKVIELQCVIVDAQSSAIDANAQHSLLVNKISTLEEKMAQMETWNREKERYKLISPWSGNFAYSLKKTMKKSEPPHWICADCYQNGKRSILQERGNQKTGRREFFCQCGSVIHAHHRGKGYNFEYS